MTRDYITKHLLEIGYSKTDEINLLNSILDYFNYKEKFDKNEFEQEIIFNLEAIDLYRNYFNTFK